MSHSRNHSLHAHNSENLNKIYHSLGASRQLRTIDSFNLNLEAIRRQFPVRRPDLPFYTPFSARRSPQALLREEREEKRAEAQKHAQQRAGLERALGRERKQGLRSVGHRGSDGWEQQIDSALGVGGEASLFSLAPGDITKLQKFTQAHRGSAVAPLSVRTALLSPDGDQYEGLKLPSIAATLQTSLTPAQVDISGRAQASATPFIDRLAVLTNERYSKMSGKKRAKGHGGGSELKRPERVYSSLQQQLKASRLQGLSKSSSLQSDKMVVENLDSASATHRQTAADSKQPSQLRTHAKNTSSNSPLGHSLAVTYGPFSKRKVGPPNREPSRAIAIRNYGELGSARKETQRLRADLGLRDAYAAALASGQNSARTLGRGQIEHQVVLNGPGRLAVEGTASTGKRNVLSQRQLSTAQRSASNESLPGTDRQGSSQNPDVMQGPVAATPRKLRLKDRGRPNQSLLMQKYVNLVSKSKKSNVSQQQALELLDRIRYLEAVEEREVAELGTYVDQTFGTPRKAQEEEEKVAYQVKGSEKTASVVENKREVTVEPSPAKPHISKLRTLKTKQLSRGLLKIPEDESNQGRLHTIRQEKESENYSSAFPSSDGEAADRDKPVQVAEKARLRRSTARNQRELLLLRAVQQGKTKRPRAQQMVRAETIEPPGVMERKALNFSGRRREADLKVQITQIKKDSLEARSPRVGSQLGRRAGGASRESSLQLTASIMNQSLLDAQGDMAEGLADSPRAYPGSPATKAHLRDLNRLSRVAGQKPGGRRGSGAPGPSVSALQQQLRLGSVDDGHLSGLGLESDVEDYMQGRLSPKARKTKKRLNQAQGEQDSTGYSHEQSFFGGMRIQSKRMIGLSKAHELHVSAKNLETLTGDEHDRLASGKFWRGVAALEAVARSQELRAHTQRQVERAREKTIAQWNIFKVFVDKVRRDIDFPESVIRLMIMTKAKEIEDSFENPDVDLVREIMKDDLINGLFMLNEVRQGTEPEITQTGNQQPALRVGQIEKAMKTIRAFQRQGELSKQDYPNLNRTLAFEKLLDQKQYMRLTTEFGRLNTWARRPSHGPNLELLDEGGNETAYSGASKDGLESTAGGRETGAEWFKNDVYTGVVKGVLAQQSNTAVKQLNKQDAGVQQFARQINLQDQYYKVLKFNSQPLVEHKFSNNPQIEYFKQCNAEFVLSLPILNKIVNRQLSLLGYNLNQGVCASLKQALSGNSRMLSGIVLEDNGTNDEQQGLIFEGLHSQEKVYRIITRKNEFGERSLEALKPLLLRKNPMQLEELRLVDCQLNPLVLHQLLQFITERTCYLNKVSFVNANFSDESFRLLLRFIEQNANLRHLDISFNSFKHSDMLKLVRLLAKDRKLIQVDLSWNQLWARQASTGAERGDTPEQSDKANNRNYFKAISESKVSVQKVASGMSLALQGLMIPASARRPLPRRATTRLLEAGSTKNACAVPEDDPIANPGFDPKKRELILNLAAFIKYNRSLQHLNLSNTGLDAEVIYHVADKALNKAHSLLSFHLDGNPGVTAKNIQFIKRRLGAREEPYCSVEIGDKDIETSDGQYQQQRMGAQLKWKEVQRRMRANDHRLKVKDLAEKQLQLVRQLGHRGDLPGSGRWQLHHENRPGRSCWVTGQWIYTLVFWSSSIGSKYQLQLKPDAKLRVVQQIAEGNPTLAPVKVQQPTTKLETRVKNLYAMVEFDGARPLICGEFNNWRPTRMLRVDEYAKVLDKGYAAVEEDLVAMMQDGAIIRDVFHLSKSKQTLEAEQHAAYATLIKKTLESYNHNWFKYLQDHLRYREPYLANSQHLARVDHPRTEQLYVYPCFVRPGRQNYVVVQQDDLANQAAAVPMPSNPDRYFVHHDCIENRDEDIPPFAKKAGTSEKDREFTFAGSVFRSWMPDSQAVLDKCLAHDFKYWKCSKFIKSSEEEEKVEEVIRSNFVYLKKVYHYLQCKSNYPGIGSLDFAGWASDIKIPDEKLPVSAVDRAFIAAKNVAEKIQGNTSSENYLARYQYLEAIVRLANMKFLETKLEKSYSEAVQRLITEHIIMRDYTEEWHEFRVQKLWKEAPNDLLEANLPGLKKVYESYLTSRSRVMAMADMVTLYLRQTELLSAEKDVVYCCGMSKMTYANETYHADSHYLVFKLSEFLESIGRVAFFKYSPGNPGMPLEQMMERVLDDILATQGLKRSTANDAQLDESESDRDY